VGNDIKFFFGKKQRIFKIDKTRTIYTNEEYDVTIIELRKGEFPCKDFLKIDDDIYKEEDFSQIYKDKSIYIIHYPKGI
jgi:hypothetical protein